MERAHRIISRNDFSDLEKFIIKFIKQLLLLLGNDIEQTKEYYRIHSYKLYKKGR
jgi:hypothetical protein